MLHLILIPTIAVDILWVNQLVTRANELADSTWLIYFYNYFEGEDIGMAHGPLMLCQSMAPRSWLQAATLRTDRRPQDVAASWAAGSCATISTVGPWHLCHFSETYLYNQLINYGFAQENHISTHFNLEKMAAEWTPCAWCFKRIEQKTVPDEKNLPKQGKPWGWVNLRPFEHNETS